MENTFTVVGRKVIVSEDGVRAFMRQWPCSGLAGTELWFEFDRDGNLVDAGPDTESQDGPALVALSQDAQKLVAA
jgi:hypothetical protein